MRFTETHHSQGPQADRLRFVVDGFRKGSTHPTILIFATLRPFLMTGIDLHRPEIVVADILERNRHDFRHRIDRHVSKELQSVAGREVVILIGATALLVNGLRTEGIVEFLWRPGSG